MKLRYKKFEIFSGETIRKSRNELMSECLKLGLPVRIDDSYKTLQLFIDLTYEKNSLFSEDDFGIEKRVKKNFFIQKLFSGIYSKIKFLFI
jgi:hypothetical protein